MTGRRPMRVIAFAYFLLYTVFLTYPGVLPFNRIRPLVLGLPFVLFWVAAWVGLGCVVLLLLHLSERAADRRIG